MCWNKDSTDLCWYFLSDLIKLVFPNIGECSDFHHTLNILEVDNRCFRGVYQTGTIRILFEICEHCNLTCIKKQKTNTKGERMKEEKLVNSNIRINRQLKIFPDNGAKNLLGRKVDSGESSVEPTRNITII